MVYHLRLVRSCHKPTTTALSSYVTVTSQVTYE